MLCIIIIIIISWYRCFDLCFFLGQFCRQRFLNLSFKFTYIFRQCCHQVGRPTQVLLEAVALFNEHLSFHGTGASLLLCGTGITAAPYLPSLLTVGIAIGTAGISMGILDTGKTTCRHLTIKWLMIKEELHNRFNLISEERVTIFKHNSEKLMKIGWKIRKLWHFEVSQIFKKTFLDQSIWIYEEFLSKRG